MTAINRTLYTILPELALILLLAIIAVMLMVGFAFRSYLSSSTQAALMDTMLE